MGSSAMSSWLMSACMRVGCGKENEKVLFECSSICSRPESGLGSVACRSSSCGSIMRRSIGLSASDSGFVDNAFSSLSGCRRRSKSSGVTHSGIAASFLPCSAYACMFTHDLAEVMAAVVQPAMEVATKKKPSTKERRVVVTGMGVATPVGHEPNVYYENLLEGVSGISDIETFDCSQFPTRIAGEIKSFSTDGWIAPKLSKRMDKFMLYMLTAGKKALADAGINNDLMDEMDKKKCGVLIGSAMGGMKVFNDAIEALRISYKKMNPFCVPFATTNMGSAILAMDLGWMGPNYSISTACATSNFCILSAANHIIRGTGVILCIEKALAQSGVSREDVNYINAHATSTPAGDLKEYQALVHCFGQNPELRVNSTKSMIGHLLGAAGGVEAVATVQVQMLEPIDGLKS
nr:3-oxoacyl-[acyl-carrier-protein] synthase II, chloroplastic-like isoform X1 [Ipomoea trifida]